MDPLKIIEIIAAIIKTAVDVGPIAIKGVEDAKPFAQAIYNNLIKHKTITQEDLNKLEDHIKELSDQLQLPLPPEED